MFEKRLLKKKLGEKNYDFLKKYNFIIAGGAIASIFTKSKINDFDVYARKESDILDFLKEVWDENCQLIYHTSRATLIRLNGVLIQLIYIRFYENTIDTFETFDFTACMGAFDFKDEQFHLHKDFLKHNSQRILVYNHHTTYPLNSALRVNKYVKKGYSISNSEYARILLSCASLKIDTWDELKDQLAGVYGENDEKTFKKLKNKKFSFKHALDYLEQGGSFTDVELNEKTLELDELLQSISSSHPKYVEIKNQTYEIQKNGSIMLCRDDKKANHVMLDIKELLPDSKMYKFVEKCDDSKYFSYYNNDFEYVIGETIVPLSSLKYNGRIYGYKKEHIYKSNFIYYTKKVLLEIAYSEKDLLGFVDDSKMIIAKGFVIREVPESEWEKWKK